MKEKLSNNLSLKLISIFFAFFVWLVVVNVSNPEVTREKEVQLEVVNEDVLLDARKTYEISGKTTITVRYDVRTMDDYKISASDFRAYIDLSDLYDVTGSVPVNVEVLSNKSLVTNVQSQQMVVKVETEDIQRKRFDLGVIQVGTPADEYALEMVETVPKIVYVEGPISKVGLISSVGIEVDVDGLSESMSGVATPIFYDANGNEMILDEKIVVETEEIAYEVTINRVKKLSLDFEVGGTVATGYRYTGLVCDTDSIYVMGLVTTLANLTKVVIPADVLNIENATADIEVTVDVSKYLPEDVQMLDVKDSTAVIRLKVEELKAKQITVEEGDILWEGKVESYEYELVPNSVTITFQGLEEELGALTIGNIELQLDVTDLEPGIQQIDLQIDVDEVFNVIGYSDFEINVISEDMMIEGFEEITDGDELEVGIDGPGVESQVEENETEE